MYTDQMVIDNLNLVDFVIRKNLHISFDDPMYEDYQQEGRYYLVLACKRFDESRGYQFSTYASRYIEGGIRRFRREKVWQQVKVPRTVLDLYPKIAELHNEGHTESDIIEVLGIKEDEYRAVMNCMIVARLDDPIEETDGKSTLVDSVPYYEDFDENLEEERIMKCIEKVSSKFQNLKHRDVWQDYVYPAYYGEKVNQTALGDKYHYSQPQIARILRRGKKLLVEALDRY